MLTCTHTSVYIHTYFSNVICLFVATYSFTECQEQAIPFFCQYYFPLKDCTTDNIYMASKEDCNRISTTVCAAPWNLAINIGYGHQLPKCDALPHGEHMIDSNHTIYFNLLQHQLLLVQFFRKNINVYIKDKNSLMFNTNS